MQLSPSQGVTHWRKAANMWRDLQKAPLEPKAVALYLPSVLCLFGIGPYYVALADPELFM